MPNVRQKMFLARMLNHSIRPVRRMLGKGMRLRCTRKGVNWNLDLDEGIDLCIYLLGAYEPRTLRAYTPLIKPGNVVFDIGANIGAHTLHFARLVGHSGKVFAFEPTDYAAGKLKANLALNPSFEERVTLEQSFLVANNAEALPKTVFSRWPVANEFSDLNTDHLGKPEALVGATAVTADQFCESANVQRIDFVKLDVDGNELTVLQGFKRGLGRFRPHVLVELAPFVYKDSRSEEFDSFVKFFLELNYDFVEAGNGARVEGDLGDIRRHIPPGGSMNFLLYPRT